MGIREESVMKNVKRAMGTDEHGLGKPLETGKRTPMTAHRTPHTANNEKKQH